MRTREEARSGILPALLLAGGALLLGLGLWQVVHPASFFESIGGFGPRNDHYVRDVATWDLALGAAFLVAAGRPSWRLPVLWFAVLQSILHLVNHVVDIGAADPSWAGPVDVVLLAVTSVALASVMAAARKAER